MFLLQQFIAETDQLMLLNGQLITLEMPNGCGDTYLVIKFSGDINCKIFHVALLRFSVALLYCIMF